MSEELIMLNTKWYLDEVNCLNYQFTTSQGDVHAFIQTRPHYCDRGHYVLNINAHFLNLDIADMFPRYYMDLNVAKEECVKFLYWRIYKKKLDRINKIVILQ